MSEKRQKHAIPERPDPKTFVILEGVTLWEGIFLIAALVLVLSIGIVSILGLIR